MCKFILLVYVDHTTQQNIHELIICLKSNRLKGPHEVRKGIDIILEIITKLL